MRVRLDTVASMFFKTKSESHDLAVFLGFDELELKRHQAQTESSAQSSVFFDGKEYVPYAAAKKWIDGLDHSKMSFLWVVEYGIWPSRENMHLFYRIRSSYGEGREINLAPGHLFSDYETADLITYVDLLLQFGWGAHLLQARSFPSIFFSHDGYAKFFSGA